MFTVYLFDPRDLKNPILIGHVRGETAQEVAVKACALIEKKYDPEKLHGWGFEAFEFSGKQRQMSGVFRNKAVA